MLSNTENAGNSIDDSVYYFKNGFYCSEALLKAFNEHYDLGLTSDLLKIATGFGAGFGASKCSCGSLTGGVMVLSLVAGRNSPEESETQAFDVVSLLHDRFKDAFGATCCRSLTKKLEWGSTDHHDYCVKYVEGAAKLVDDILRERLKISPVTQLYGHERGVKKS